MSHSATEPDKNAFPAVLRRLMPQELLVRYVAAAAAAAAGLGLRLALTAWIGPGLPTYTTFYPAVMVAALLFGFGPGLVTTFLAGLAVAYWVLPPVGQIILASPVERLGLAIFFGMGLFMSLVARLYRRSREKAAAYDREVALREGEEALREASERFRIVADFTYDFEYWIGPDGRFLYVSPSCERIIDYSRDELLKDPDLFFRTIHPEDRERVLSHVREEITGASPSELEFRVLRRDGEELWVSHVCQPVLDSAGRSLGRRASNRDITKRRIAEEVLRETGEFLENLFTYANAPIVCWDTKFKITRFNPAFEHLTNYKLEEVLGKDLSMLFPADTRKESLSKIRRTLSGEHWEVVEIPVLRKDGEVRMALWNSANVYAADGTTLTTVIAQGQDITERKQAEQRLRRSNESLEQFAYVASHDLQEPLRVVASYSQLLERRYKNKLDRDADDFIEFIVDAANRMQKLITDLLAFSRVGSKDVAPGRVDSNEVIQKVIAALSPTIEENKATVTYERLPVLIAPEVSFTQLFQNLLGNALKFRGIEPPAIHVAAAEHDNEWFFSVRDNGIGIEPQYKERIFQIFQRLHAKQEYPGTGIGLSICKKIVENWGGRIWVESELGKGATFFFTIPTERR